MDEPEIVRVDGNAVCPVCDKPYWRHPMNTEILSYDDHLFLRDGCRGELLKL